ncbi:MAG: 20S proteasome subunit A/B [Haloferacaceae archaeon]
MSTVVGVECTDGALLAGDRLLVDAGRVRSRAKRHVFSFDGVGAAAVGDGVDAFERRLDAALREYRTDRGEVDVETLARLASPVAADVDVDAVVAARDDGAARVRGVDRTGATFDDPLVAFGSGAQFVLGSLERASTADLDATETRVREAFAAAAERDAGTGSDVDALRVE